MKKNTPKSPAKSYSFRFWLYALSVLLLFVVVILLYYNPSSTLNVSNRTDNERTASSNSVIHNAETSVNNNTLQQGLERAIISDDVIKNNFKQLVHDVQAKTQELAGKDNELEVRLELYRQYLKAYNTFLTYFNNDIGFTRQLEYLNKITFPLSVQDTLDNLEIYNKDLITQHQSAQVVFPKSDGFIDKILKPVIEIRSVKKVDKSDIVRSVDLLTKYIYSKTFMKRFIEND